LNFRKTIRERFPMELGFDPLLLGIHFQRAAEARALY
jgi:hypothetical protein